MKRGVKIKQHYENDCGVAALSSVASYFGLRLPMALIRVYTNSSYAGTTIGGIIAGAAKFNIEAFGFKGDLSSLQKINAPAILHIRKNKNRLHYVVMYKYKNDTFYIMDPSDGKLHKIKSAQLKEVWTGYLVILKKGEDFIKGNYRVNLIEQFSKILKGEWLYMILILFLSLSFLVVAGATSYFIKILTDYIIPEGNLKLLKIAGLAAIIILIVSLIFSYFKSMIALRMGLRVDKKVISKFLAHTVKLPQKFFDLRKSGEISSRFFESFKVRLLLTDITISLIISFVSLVTAFIFMFTIYKPLALAALLFIPIYIGIYLFFDSINKENIWKMAEEMSGFESFVNDTIKSMKSIKYFGMEKFYEQRGVIVIDKMNNQIQKSGFNFIIGASVNESLTKILTFSVLILGAGSVLNNQLTTGDLLSFFTLLALFSTPLSQIAGIGKEVRSGLVTAERIFEITQLETEWKNEGQKSIPDDFEYISLENLSFRYPNRSALLINTNFRIEKGTITLLRGKNGSGKSTIGALLTGIYKADSGRVTIDGIDIDKFKLDEWRNFISIVPQNLEILTGTLLENIVPGVKEINFERLFGIIEELHLTDFLNRLPMGLETMLTENILLLSRGEQQRIAVARAVYRNPGVLILDEATASLDAISEAAIVSLIIKLKNEGCTILMITHKESDFAIADKIIEL